MNEAHDWLKAANYLSNFTKNFFKCSFKFETEELTLFLILSNSRNWLNSIVGNMHETFLRRNLYRYVLGYKNGILGANCIKC